VTGWLTPEKRNPHGQIGLIPLSFGKGMLLAIPVKRGKGGKLAHPKFRNPHRQIGLIPLSVGKGMQLAIPAKRGKGVAG